MYGLLAEGALGWAAAGGDAAGDAAVEEEDAFDAVAGAGVGEAGLFEVPGADEEVERAGGSVDLEDVDVAAGEGIADVAHFLDSEGEFVAAAG
jgi:hypothetical protein